MDQQNKNVILAFVLSGLVLLLWQVFYVGPKTRDEQDRLKRQEAIKTLPASPDQKTTQAPTPSQPNATQTTQPAYFGPIVSRFEAIKQSPRVQINTETVKGSIALRGGIIDDLELLRYRETVDPKSPPITLFSPPSTAHPYFAQHLWSAAQGSNIKVPGPATVWTVEGQPTLAPGKPVTITHANGEGLIFKRTFEIDANYMFKIRDEVENTTGQPVTLSLQSSIVRQVRPQVEGFLISFEGLIGTTGTKYHELGYDSVADKGGSKTFNDTEGWIGFTDKYWAAAVIPDQKLGYAATFQCYYAPGDPCADSKNKQQRREVFETDIKLAPTTVAAGQKVAIDTNLFAGAKRVELIESYAKQLGAKKFDLLIDWGYLYFITKPLFIWILNPLFKMLGNFGLAILATTVLVKLVFFPLQNKSYASMSKMKKLQPEMERIKERFKDDRMRMQQAQMELFKKEKVNPMAGCVPIVLQIPVFFALYKLLFTTIEMRHAPFFGWIRDLSAPDPTTFVNLFGLLPFAVPGWLDQFIHIGIWPLLMGFTMWFQMKLNPAPTDPMQQKIFAWMPVVFTYMLGSFASGLVIYWTWNNILSVAQQSYIMKKNGVEVPLIKNLGIDKLTSRLRPERKPAE